MRLARHLTLPRLVTQAGIFGFCFIALTASGCREGDISGAYISRGPDFAEMLQLTEANDGQITGSLSTIDLNDDGKLNSDNASIVGGTFSNGQLTLVLHSTLLGQNVSGTKSGNTIQLEAVGSKGEVFSYKFKRGSPDDFQQCAVQLKSKAEAIAKGKTIADGTKVLQQTVQNAERWLSYAQLHADRIPNGKDLYKKLEGKMQSLIAQEQSTSNRVSRSQIEVAVSQTNIAAGQMDMQENDLWDQSIEESGLQISKRLATEMSLCDQGNEYRIKQIEQQGVSDLVVRRWQSSCAAVMAEQAKFEPVYEKIVGQRADLKSFQEAAQSRREALVAQAESLR